MGAIHGRELPPSLRAATIAIAEVSRPTAIRAASRLTAAVLGVICLVAAPAAAQSPGRLGTETSTPRDLADVVRSGEIRHLGVPYANFVTGTGDGLDVELIRAFAEHVGIRYAYVETDWDRVVSDLIGKTFRRDGNRITVTGTCPVRGDLVANGMTLLPWREQLVRFSRPTFPTQIWVVTRADSPLVPILPSGDLSRDIQETSRLLRGRSVLCKPGTCLDPKLFPFSDYGAEVRLFTGSLNHVAPALINGEAETTILDVPDALIALRKWPGRIKVIGPLSQPQQMAVAFAPESPALREAFAAFLDARWKDGTYLALVRKYYPTVFAHYPAFFAEGTTANETTPPAARVESGESLPVPAGVDELGIDTRPGQ